jgi:hypothetical protein
MLQNKIKNMKKIILTFTLCLFLIGIISAASINTYYNLNLNYNNGKLNLLSNNIEQSKEIIDNSYGKYALTLSDHKDNVIYIGYFDVPNTEVYEKIDKNGTIYGESELILNKVNFTLLIPYYDNATKIEIYDENVTKKLEIDVSFYSKKYEEYKEFDAIKQNISNENESTNQENTSVNESVTTKEETPVEIISHYWWILLIILIILLGVLVRYIIK